MKEQTSIAISKPIKEFIQEISMSEKRSVSNMVEVLLTEALIARGIIPTPNNKRRNLDGI